MDAELPVLAILLALFFLADAIACAIPLRFIQDDLNRLYVPLQVQRALPVVKGAAFLGLLIGLWVPLLGLLAAIGGVAYFVIALQYHERAGDDLLKYLPAFAVGLWCVLVAGFSYAPAI